MRPFLMNGSFEGLETGTFTRKDQYSLFSGLETDWHKVYEL